MSEDSHWPTVLLIGAAHSPRGASGEALERDFPRASRLRRRQIAYILTLLFSPPRSKSRPYTKDLPLHSPLAFKHRSVHQLSHLVPI